MSNFFGRTVDGCSGCTLDFQVAHIIADKFWYGFWPFHPTGVSEPTAWPAAGIVYRTRTWSGSSGSISWSGHLTQNRYNGSWDSFSRVVTGGGFEVFYPYNVDATSVSHTHAEWSDGFTVWSMDLSDPYPLADWKQDCVDLLAMLDVTLVPLTKVRQIHYDDENAGTLPGGSQYIATGGSNNAWIPNPPVTLGPAPTVETDPDADDFDTAAHGFNSWDQTTGVYQLSKCRANPWNAAFCQDDVYNCSGLFGIACPDTELCSGFADPGTELIIAYPPISPSINVGVETGDRFCYKGQSVTGGSPNGCPCHA